MIAVCVLYVLVSYLKLLSMAVVSVGMQTVSTEHLCDHLKGMYSFWIGLKLGLKQINVTTARTVPTLCVYRYSKVVTRC